MSKIYGTSTTRFSFTRFIIKNTYFTAFQCLRTVIDRDDGMLSRRLAENRCGNFKQLDRPVVNPFSSGQWYAVYMNASSSFKVNEILKPHIP
jgi:hypothetical protein